MRSSLFLHWHALIQLILVRGYMTFDSRYLIYRYDEYIIDTIANADSIINMINNNQNHNA